MFLVRCLFSPFAHPLFTTFIGIGVGIAVGSRSRGVRIAAPLAGYLLAVVAHAIWNGSTLYGFTGFVGVYVVLMAPAFVGMVGARGVGPQLRAADAGRVADRRRAARADPRHRHRVAGRASGPVAPAAPTRSSTAGRRRYRAMRDYQQAAVELGFLHHRFLRGVPPPDFAERGQDYVARIAAARPFVAFPGQVVPSR